MYEFQIPLIHIKIFILLLHLPQKHPFLVIDKCVKLILFQGRLDLSKPIVMGHSFGGATAMYALATDPRFEYAF